MAPSHDGTEMIPVPVPQVGLRRETDDWRFLTEKELTPENVQEFREASSLEIRIYGVGSDCDRLRQRLAVAGIDFVETGRATNQPITEQSALTVVYDINVDETIVRAACKIAFNYAAKVLGPGTVRDARFDAARRQTTGWPSNASRLPLRRRSWDRASRCRRARHPSSETWLAPRTNG